MAPFTQDYNASLSSHDDIDMLDRKTTIAPLHKSAFTTPRRVSFHPIVRAKIVMNRFAYTPEELEASWYDNDDYLRMRVNVKVGADNIDSGFHVRGTGICIRGLETRTREGNKNTNQQRMDAYAAVFSEIEFQKEIQWFDEEKIAYAYFAYSGPCAVTAEMMGQRDEFEAKNIYYQERNAIPLW